MTAAAASPKPKGTRAAGKAAPDEARGRSKGDLLEVYEGPIFVRSTASGAVKMIGMRRTRSDGVFEFYGMESGYRLSSSTVGQQVTRFVTRQADNASIQTFAQFQAWAAPLLPAGAKDWFEHQVWVRT